MLQKGPTMGVEQPIEPDVPRSPDTVEHPPPGTRPAPTIPPPDIPPSHTPDVHPVPPPREPGPTVI